MPRESNQRLAKRQSPHQRVAYILIVSCSSDGYKKVSATNSSLNYGGKNTVSIWFLQHSGGATYSRLFEPAKDGYPSTVCSDGALIRSNITSRNFLPLAAISPGLRARMPITRPALKSPRSAWAI